MKDKKRGCLYGLAVGDALGAAIEFKQPGEFAPITTYRAGGPHSLAAGQFTDDTSMALALADSIGRGWDIDDQIRQYMQWWQKGKYSVTGVCFDIGTTTRLSLTNYERYITVESCADRDEGSSGNGSIMRLAPVPIKYHDLYPRHVAELNRLAAQSSLVTHASYQCRSACRYMATVLAALINGEGRDEVLSPLWPGLVDIEEAELLHPSIKEVVQGSYRSKARTIRGSGWVVQSLEAALWAFHDAKDFREAVLKAVNLGDDADSTGAVCGQFAGAYWGESGIPKDLMDGLACKDMIEEALKSLGV